MSRQAELERVINEELRARTPLGAPRFLSLDEIARARGWVPPTRSQIGSLRRTVYRMAEEGRVHVNHAHDLLRSDLRPNTLIVCARESVTIPRVSDQGVSSNRPEEMKGQFVQLPEAKRLAHSVLKEQTALPHLRQRGWSDDQVLAAAAFLIKRKSDRPRSHFVVAKDLRERFRLTSDRQGIAALRRWLEDSPDAMGIRPPRRYSSKEIGKIIQNTYKAMTEAGGTHSSTIPVEPRQSSQGNCEECGAEGEIRDDNHLCAVCDFRAFLHNSLLRQNAARRQTEKPFGAVGGPGEFFTVAGYESPYRRGGFLWSESYVATAGKPRYPLDSLPEPRRASFQPSEAANNDPS